MQFGGALNVEGTEGLCWAGVAWHSIAWHGMAWHGMAWHLAGDPRELSTHPHHQQMCADVPRATSPSC